MKLKLRYLLLTFLTLSILNILTSPISSAAINKSSPLTITISKRLVTIFPSKSTPHAALISLPGLGEDSHSIEMNFPLQQTLQNNNYLYLNPSGAIDKEGHLFWNADDSCCNIFHQTTNDQNYLVNLSKYLHQKYQLPYKHIYLIGHSNGAFMAGVLACQNSKYFGGSILINGSLSINTKKCSSPSNILIIKSQDDTVINAKPSQPVLGIKTLSLYLSLKAYLKLWETTNSCTRENIPVTLKNMLKAQYSETIQKTYSCKRGSLTVWTLTKAAHTPELNSNFGNYLLSYLQTLK